MYGCVKSIQVLAKKGNHRNLAVSSNHFVLVWCSDWGCCEPSFTVISLVNQPVFLRMREGEKNGLAKLARFLKSLGMCNGILAPINCMRA